MEYWLGQIDLHMATASNYLKWRNNVLSKVIKKKAVQVILGNYLSCQQLVI